MTSYGRVISAAFAFSLVALAASHAEAKTITNVGAGGCSLSQAIAAANNNTLSGTSCTGDAIAFDQTGLSGNNKSCAGGITGDVVILSAGTFNVGNPGLEIYSCVEIRGAAMGTTIISFANNNGPSGNHGITIWDCNGMPAGFYVSSASNEQPPNINLVDLTIKQTANNLTMGVCAVRGILETNRVRVTGFKDGGLVGFSKATSEDDPFGGPGVYLYGSLVDLNQSPANGGGVATYGYQTSLGVYNSSIVNNVSGGGGGGVFDGHLGSQEVAHIDNSTISGNTANGDGGGLLSQLDVVGNNSYMTLHNVTIARNHATGYGGGIYQLTGCMIGSDLQIFDSIVNNNVADSSPPVIVNGQTFHEEDNLNLNQCINGNASRSCINTMMFLPGSDWDGSGQRPTNPNGFFDFNVPDALLASLAGQGGVNNLPVHALLAGSPGVGGSPAIDRIPCVVCGVSGGSGLGPDERGVARAQFGGSDGTAYDIGAFELVARMETEKLAVAAKKSSVTHVVVTGAGYSGTQGTNLQATTSNWQNPSAFVTYTSPSQLLPATYNVVVGFKKGSNEGKFQFAIADTLSGTYTNVGGVQDGYLLSNSWVSVNLGNVVIATQGSKFLRFTVTGKNASSSSYQLFPDFVVLTRQ